jgi:tRNA(Ile)-lysidine synthase
MADTRRAVREWASQLNSTASSTYLVAVSGGGDSLALAWAAGIELPKLGFSVGAVVVDHQLQPDSAKTAEWAAHQASTLGLSPVVIKTVIATGSGGPEEAARKARYQAFSEAVHETGATGVLLAHTEDDQAETVLLGLARGSGPGSLKGMALHDGVLHRPLLGLSRSVLRQALADAGVEWWEDPHNSDERFARVRVRNDVMPVLENALGPGISQALARTAELFREDAEALELLAAQVVDQAVVRHSPAHVSVNVIEVMDLHPAVVGRVLRTMILVVGGGTPSYAQTKAMLALVTSWKGQSVVSVPGASLERLGTEIHARASAE